MGGFYLYLKAFALGVTRPFQSNTQIGDIPYEQGHDLAWCLGNHHGRWLGRWLHGKPTRAMIFKLFVVASGVAMGLGYVCIDQYYRPLTGLLIGTCGAVGFLFWGISPEDLDDE